MEQIIQSNRLPRGQRVKKNADSKTGFTKLLNTNPQLYKQQTGVIAYPNGQFCISSGNSSLDTILGGGFPFGSLIVLYEDTHSQFYSHFLKTYLAEGVVNSQECLIVDSKDSFRQKDFWVKFLPNVVKLKDQIEEEKNSQNIQENLESLNIQQEKLVAAWRYNNLLEKSLNAGEIEVKPNQSLGKGISIKYKFDNSKSMGDTIQNSISHKLDKQNLINFLNFDNEGYENIAQKLPLHLLWEKICEQMQQRLVNEEDDRIFRILLPDFNLFVPQLEESGSLKNNYSQCLIRFLRNLKSLVRASNCTCLISVDSNLLPVTSEGEPQIQANLDNLADIILQITSFKDQIELKIGEYDGTLKILKQARLHGIISHLSQFDIYAFKIKKGKTGISIEKIHLDPEDDRTGQDENLEQKGVSKSKKNVGKQNNIDF